MPGPILPGPWRENDPLPSAEEFNAIKQAVERASGSRTGSGLGGYSGGSIRAIHGTGPDSFLATLSGAGGGGTPYSFAECDPDGTATIGGRTGANAYAANGESSLAGSIARLYPTAWDHRFVIPRRIWEDGDGCGVPASLRFCVGADCCPVPEATVTVTDPSNGDAVVNTCSPASWSCCAFAVDLPEGTVLNYTIEVTGWPTKSGTITVGDCGETSTAYGFWTIPEIIPLTLNATVTGDPAIIGGGGTWTGALVCDGTPVIFSGELVYTWTSGCIGGLGHWSDYELCCCFDYNLDDGTCNDNSAYGGGIPSGGVRLKVFSTTDYVSTRISMSITVPGETVGQPEGPCRIGFAWVNYREADCVDSLPYQPTYWTMEEDCPCGVLTYEECGIGWGSHTTPPYPKPEDWHIPNCFYPSNQYLGWDLGTADDDLESSCLPFDVSGTAIPWFCSEGGTVHITE